LTVKVIKIQYNAELAPSRILLIKVKSQRNHK